MGLKWRDQQFFSFSPILPAPHKTQVCIIIKTSMNILQESVKALCSIPFNSYLLVSMHRVVLGMQKRLGKSLTFHVLQSNCRQPSAPKKLLKHIGQELRHWSQS